MTKAGLDGQISLGAVAIPPNPLYAAGQLVVCATPSKLSPELCAYLVGRLGVVQTWYPQDHPDKALAGKIVVAWQRLPRGLDKEELLALNPENLVMVKPEGLTADRP